MATRTKKATTKAEPVRKTPAKAKTFEGTMDSITDQFTKVGTAVLKTLDGAKGELLPLLTTYQELQGAVATAREELSDLGEIGDTAQKLADLEVELQDRQAKHEERLKEIELEEQQRVDDLTTARKREEEDYTYKIRRARKQAEDTWSDELTAARRKIEAELAEIAVTAAELQEKERELEEREARVTEMVAEETEKAAGQAKRQIESAIAAAKREASFSVREAELQRDNLAKQLEAANKALADAAVKIQAAEERAATIAQTAIEASSGRQALQAVQQAQATASTNGKNGR